jgi:hypothetical protein
MGDRRWAKRTALAGVALMSAAAGVAALAQPLPNDTVVRVRSPSLGAGWLDGKVGVAANRCTMVFLRDPAPGGTTSMALNAVKALQKRDGAAWVDVDVKPWLAKEPKACREADND